MKDLMKLSDGKEVIELPLENFLRVFFVKAQPFALEYQQETKKSDIVGFFDWLKDKLEMRGGQVLI
jgi:hypothetical protein